MHREISLNFEHVVRQFLGDKAYHIAGSVHHDREFRKWLRKCIVVMQKRVEEMDTTVRHKEMLLREITLLNDLLKTKGGGSDKEIILSLFWLTSRLFGFDGVSGKVYNEPLYHQTYGQYFKQLLTWERYGDSLYHLKEEERGNTITVQRKLYLQLKDEGLTDIQIAKIFNTSEHQIKKLKYDT